MLISKAEFMARHGEKYAPYYREYDSDLKPDHNFRILMEMTPPRSNDRRNFWITVGLIVVVCILVGYFII